MFDFYPSNWSKVLFIYCFTHSVIYLFRNRFFYSFCTFIYYFFIRSFITL